MASILSIHAGRADDADPFHRQRGAAIAPVPAKFLQFNLKMPRAAAHPDNLMVAIRVFRCVAARFIAMLSHAWRLHAASVVIRLKEDTTCPVTVNHAELKHLPANEQERARDWIQSTD